MNSTPKDSKLARLKSDWVEDAVKLQDSTLRTKRIAGGVTIISCALYAVLYMLIGQYREQVADIVRELPIFVRIMLDISQPFLIVFIIISVSMLILLYLKMKKPWLSAKSLLILIAFNCVFAATLLAVSSLKII